MLHAIYRSKTRYYQRYHGDRSDTHGERHVREEDEITSTFLGPLDFMQPGEILGFWREVLRLIGRAEILPNAPLHNAELRLWPSSSDGRRIEPDAVLELHWTDGARRILLLEFKWRAPLSGEDQLHRQWQHYLGVEERRDAYHLFIAPEVSAGAAARNSEIGDVWSSTDGNRLILIPWETIRSALDNLKVRHAADTRLARWSIIADRYLERIGIYRFGGFRSLNPLLDSSLVATTPLFWKPFGGFMHLDFTACGDLTVPPTLFFHINQQGENHG